MNRGLTLAEAMAGVQPAPLTRAEWTAMHHASIRAQQEARARHHAVLGTADCPHPWTAWERHATGAVRRCPACGLVEARPAAEGPL